jgi:hypothetical protein
VNVDLLEWLEDSSDRELAGNIADAGSNRGYGGCGDSGSHRALMATMQVDEQLEHHNQSNGRGREQVLGAHMKTLSVMGGRAMHGGCKPSARDSSIRANKSPTVGAFVPFL